MEFMKLRIELDGRPTITFGLVYEPVGVTRGASTRMAEPSQAESLAEVPEKDLVANACNDEAEASCDA